MLRIRATEFRRAISDLTDAHVHLDIDGKDEGALHIFALDADGGLPEVVAYARLLPGDEIDPDAMIDKLLTSAARRDDDTTDRLIEHVLAAAYVRCPRAKVRTHSPIHHEAFYKRFGFRKIDGPFLQHGMPFIGMVHAMDGGRKPTRNLLRAKPREADRSIEGESFSPHLHA